MTTVWSPAPYITKQEWLLADGSIVVSPDFETTSSGRRVRIAGTTTSAGSRQTDELITAAIDTLAKQRGTERLIRIFPQEDEQKVRAGVVGAPAEVFTQAATLHINADHSSSNTYGVTYLLWDFEAVGLPIAATIFAVLDQRQNRCTVSTKVVWRATHLVHAGQPAPIYYHHDGSNMYLHDLYRHSPDFRVVDEAVTKRDGLLGPDMVLNSQVYTSQFRQAVVAFAERAKAIDNLDEIELPDLRVPGQVSFLKFKRKTSNYSASVHNELLAMVQTGPLLERITTSYNDLVNAMSQLGVVLRTRPGDTEFAKAAAGDLTQLKVTCAPTEDNDTVADSIDHNHTVTIDLATGSVIVNCSLRTDPDEVAEAWNIAKFKADLTGEVDLLLAYAQAYRDPKEQARIRKIIQQRTTPDTL